MEKKVVNIVDAYHIDVFVEMNDYDDIKCGGSPTLGYDFYIDINHSKKDLEKIIALMMKKHNRYYQRISIDKVSDFREDKLWTLDKIEECIKTTSVC
jgi:hypothetical protein